MSRKPATSHPAIKSVSSSDHRTTEIGSSESAANGAPPTLPRSLAAALPTAIQIMGHVAAIERCVPNLEREMLNAEKAGAVGLARSFAVLHRLREALLSGEKNRFKPIDRLFRDYSELKVPAVFEQDGVTHVPLAGGFRVGVSHTFRASIKKDMKDQAYAWLRGHKLGDIITATVNASTLSAAGKALRDEHNVDLPEELFTAADVPNTSVTKT